MAPRRRGPAAAASVLRAVTNLAVATILVLPCFFHISDAAAPSPTTPFPPAAPALAPPIVSPTLPPRQNATPTTNPGATPAPPILSPPPRQNATPTTNPGATPQPPILSPPPRQNVTTTASPGATPQPPPTTTVGHRHRGACGPRAAAAAAPLPREEGEERPPLSRSWWQGLNLGQKVGLALVAVAIGMQVAFVAFLAARARRMSRAEKAWGKWDRRESPARASTSIGGLL